MVQLLLLVSVGFYSGLSIAEVGYSSELPRKLWNIQLENDSFLSNESDRYYTGGLQISRLTINRAIKWQQDLLEWITADKNYVASSVEYSIGMNIFSPADTSLRLPDPDDRPYAGWLYGTAATSFLLEKTPSMDTFQFIELTLGIVGPSSMAEDFQEGIHNLLDVTEHQGRDSQLKDGLDL